MVACEFNGCGWSTNALSDGARACKEKFIFDSGATLISNPYILPPLYGCRFLGWNPTSNSEGGEGFVVREVRESHRMPLRRKRPNTNPSQNKLPRK